MSRIAISLPGNPVQTASLGKKVLDSSYPSPKIDTQANPPHAGIININQTNPTLSVPEGTILEFHSFPHNYGYIPTVFASYSLTDATGTANGVLPFIYPSVAVIFIDSDIKNIRLRLLSLIPDPLELFTMQIRFYVMAERGYE